MFAQAGSAKEFVNEELCLNCHSSDWVSPTSIHEPLHPDLFAVYPDGCLNCHAVVGDTPASARCLVCHPISNPGDQQELADSHDLKDPAPEPNCSTCHFPDADSDGIADDEDDDTVYGKISGDIQEGVIVTLYRLICGMYVLEDTTTTNTAGYYSFGDLYYREHKIIPENVDYSFAPELVEVQLPQTVITSHDFTATSITP